MIKIFSVIANVYVVGEEGTHRKATTEETETAGNALMIAFMKNSTILIDPSVSATLTESVLEISFELEEE